jgi:hypothetical protein
MRQADETTLSELRGLYEAVDAEIAAHRPACAISGRCCRFHEYGHTLFLTALEAEYLLAVAPPPVRPLDDGATCPWQDRRGHCQARGARPLGCRIYYCDPSFQDAMPEITESALGRLRTIVGCQGRDWDYAPLHDHLRRAQTGLATPADSPAS